jgi:TolB-like protein
LEIIRTNTYLLINTLLIICFLTTPSMSKDSLIRQPEHNAISNVSSIFTSRSERSRLAVLKFINTSPKEKADYYQPWEYGIAAMLTTDLEETAMFNIVDRERLNDVLQELKLQQSGLVDQKTAVTIGRLIASKYMLTGTFMVIRGKLKISAQVFSVENGVQLGATSVTGKTDNFFLLEKELFTKVTHILKVMLDEEKQAKIMSNIETRSMHASLKNYSGEEALLMAKESRKLGMDEEAEKHVKDAKQDFKEALTYDPDYERAKKNLAKLVMAIPMTL